MSGSITFRHGPFQHWSVDLYATYHDGRLISALVQIATPHPYRHGQPKSLSGSLTLMPGLDGWAEAEAAEVHAGPVRMAELLQWVVEATRSALDRYTNVPAAQRQHWQAIVERADETRADFFARYPDGVVPPFEVIARLSFAAADLAGAR